MAERRALEQPGNMAVAGAEGNFSPDKWACFIDFVRFWLRVLAGLIIAILDASIR